MSYGEKEVTIGTDAEVVNYKTKQEGYGRQGLYVELDGYDGYHFVKSVFPNIMEYADAVLFEDAFELRCDECRDDFFQCDECEGKYTDHSGIEKEVYDSTLDVVKDLCDGEVIVIDEEDESEDEDEDED